MASGSSGSDMVNKEILQHLNTISLFIKGDRVSLAFSLWTSDLKLTKFQVNEIIAFNWCNIYERRILIPLAFRVKAMVGQ